MKIKYTVKESPYKVGSWVTSDVTGPSSNITNWTDNNSKILCYKVRSSNMKETFITVDNVKFHYAFKVGDLKEIEEGRKDCIYNN